MASPARSVALIGMPGSGKSTIGVLLAKELAYHFVDTDLVIQDRAGTTLQDIIDTQGTDVVRQLEEEAVLSMPGFKHVISTGGSAVYSEAGMSHLKQVSTLVYLEASLPSLMSRVRNFGQRGIVRRPGQTLEHLLDERRQLYEHYADLRIPTDDVHPADVVNAVISALDVTGKR